jgi:hypothetical protein
MVEGARPSRLTTERIECPAISERDISSRSATVNASLERRRGAGCIPPVSARILCIDE